MSERGGRERSGGGLPAAPERIPGLPENAHPFELSEFRTLNRQVSRASIHDQDMAWCHNLAPIGSHYLRATPDNDAAIYDTAVSASGAIINWFDFWVDKDDIVFCIAFLNDGSAQQIRMDTGAVVSVGPPGTFTNQITAPPSMIQAGLAGGVVVLIVSAQFGAIDTANGYFIWDGTNLFKAGTVSPVATIADGGNNYASAPTVVVYGGAGTGAAVTAKIDLGAVSEIVVTAPGSGYLSTDSAILLFNDGVRRSAVGVGNTSDGVMTSLTLVSGGSGFTSVPNIIITPVAGGSGATAVVTSISGGIITGVKMLTGGSLYAGGATVTTSGGGGTGVILYPVIEDRVVTSVTMTDPGAGYDRPPDIVYHSTSGAGASGVAVVLGGQVTGVRFDFPSQGGSGYETPPIVQFVGGGGIAAGTIDLMPFGIVGTDIESYVGRVWIADRNRLFFTAPESLVDFGNGGGVFQDTDSFLRVVYKRLKQNNGFLYLIGDSSVNYISGVQTGPISSTNVTPITTFTNLNIDPQIGATWASSVVVWSREIPMGNTNGIFSIAGGAIKKISESIDKIFYEPPTDLSPLGGYLPSAAITRLFGNNVLAYLHPVFDPFTQTHRAMLLMWNGRRWWTADQSARILLINNYEAGSTNQAYGTDGTKLYKLLINQSSSLLSRILQSKLWLHPSILIEKKAWAIYALFECYSDTVLNFKIDNETVSISVTGAFTSTGGTQNTPKLTWARSGSSAPAGMTIGFTLTSTSKDFALLTALLVWQDYSSRT